MDITTKEKKTYQSPCMYVEDVELSPLCGVSNLSGEGGNLGMGGGNGGPFRSNPFRSSPFWPFGGGGGDTFGGIPF